MEAQSLSEPYRPVKYKGHYVEKTWGYEAWAVNKEYCGKLLYFRAGLHCSMHFHVKKDETFMLQRGRVFINLVDRSGEAYQIILLPGDCLNIPAGQLHQICCSVEGDSELFEFSTHHEDSDSYRVHR